MGTIIVGIIALVMIVTSIAAIAAAGIMSIEGHEKAGTCLGRREMK